MILVIGAGIAIVLFLLTIDDINKRKREEKDEAE
jgi:hypothetical protein